MRLDDLFDVGAKDGPEVVSDRILTVPNLLSLVRLLALPFVYLDIVGGRPVRALVVLAVVASTDWIDGYVARRFDQVSKLGKLLDPISDRVLIVTVVVALGVADIAPWWALGIVVLRDLLVAGTGLVLLGRGGEPPAVTRVGKSATFALMTSFPLLLLAEGAGDGVRDVVRLVAFAVLALGAVLYYVSAGQYAQELRHRGAGSPR